MMSFRLPEGPTPAPADVLARRATKLLAVLGDLQKGLRGILVRPFQFVDPVATYKTAQRALEDLGDGAQTNTLYDMADACSCAIAADQLFYAVTGGLLMRLQRAQVEERIRAGKVEGLLFASGAEIMNMIIGTLGRDLAAGLKDPTFCFPRDEANQLTDLPDEPLLVVAAAALVDGNLTGRLEMWLPDALVARL